MTEKEYVEKVRKTYEEFCKEPSYGFGYFIMRSRLISAILDGKEFPETCEALKREYGIACGF